jgi:hypothetical protein
VVRLASLLQGAGWRRRIQTGKGTPAPTPGGGGRPVVLDEEGEAAADWGSSRATDEDARDEAARRMRAEVAAARAPVGLPDPDRRAAARGLEEEASEGPTPHAD